MSLRGEFNANHPCLRMGMPMRGVHALRARSACLLTSVQSGTDVLELEREWECMCL